MSNKESDNTVARVFGMIAVVVAVIALMADLQRTASGGNEILAFFLGPFFMFGAYWILKQAKIF